MSNMPDHHVIDPVLDHYQTFYDTEWATRMRDAVVGTKLEPHVFNLCESWKALGNVFRMPWLLILGLKSFAEGQQQDSSVAMYAGNVAAEFADRLVGKLDFPVTKLNRIREAVYETEKEFRERAIKANDAARAAYRFPGDELWEGWCQSKEFQFALVGNQRVCYGGLFYGYESYIREAMAIMEKKNDYWLSHKTICKDLTPYVGKAVAERCTDSTIRAAKEVRNAFAHNGGKKTAQLTESEKEFAQRGEDFPVQLLGDEIHIIAEDTQRLAIVLKERVELLTGAVLRWLAANP